MIQNPNLWTFQNLGLNNQQIEKIWMRSKFQKTSESREQIIPNQEISVVFCQKNAKLRNTFCHKEAEHILTCYSRS